MTQKSVKSYEENVSCWHWQFFTAPELPEMEEFQKCFRGNFLTLQEGKTVQGTEFSFPEDGKFDLKELLPPEARERERFVLAADFTAEEDSKLLLGFGFNWRWTLRFNGVLLLDARKCGNSERPIMAENHIQELDIRKGSNLLLFEAFGGSYMAGEFRIMGKREPLALEYPPFITFPDAEERAVTVSFSANGESPAAVEYRKQGASEWKRVYDNLGGLARHDKKIHCIRLRDLSPGSMYEYRTVLVDDKRAWEEIFSETDVFCAPSDETEFSFLLTADLQNKQEREKFLESLLQTERSREAAFFVFCGDLFWTSDFDGEVMKGFVVPYRKYSENHLPLVMVRGNHEIYGMESSRFFDYFSAPEPGREGYTIFRRGQVCFLVLDFLDDNVRVPPPSTRRYLDVDPYLEAERAWLKRAVTLPVFQEAKFRIVLSHGIPVGDPGKVLPENVRKAIDPVFGGKDPAAKIHLWLGGHIHRPLRSIPNENAFYSMLSPAVFPPDRQFPPIGKNYSFPVLTVGGPSGGAGPEYTCTSIEVSVTDSSLTVRSFDLHHKEFDAFSISPEGRITEYGHVECLKRYGY
ncbi:MAG: metallophosphoesterase family protein [Lentisphaeria bacterium]|nr:metallophosphoesterase family protein [Lentisphaeria bacterium]